MSKTATPEQVAAKLKREIDRALERFRKADATLYHAKKEHDEAATAARIAFQRGRIIPLAELDPHVQYWRQYFIGLTPEEVAAVQAEQDARVPHPDTLRAERLERKIAHGCTDAYCKECDL